MYLQAARVAGFGRTYMPRVQSYNAGSIKRNHHTPSAARRNATFLSFETFDIKSEVKRKRTGRYAGGTSDQIQNRLHSDHDSDSSVGHPHATDFQVHKNRKVAPFSVPSSFVTQDPEQGVSARPSSPILLFT